MHTLARLLALAVAAGALAAPAAAQAPAPPPAGDFGGGAIKVPLGAVVGKGNLMLSFRSGGDGSVRMFATIRGRCVGATVRRTLSLAPDGSFTATGRVSRRFTIGRGRGIARYTISGRLGADGGSGTATARLTRREPGRKAERCRSGNVPWTVRPAADAAAAPAPAPGGARLHGFTSQEDAGAREALVLQVAGSGRRIDGVLFGYEVSCRRNRIKIDHSTFNVGRRIKVRADGSFRSVDKYRIQYADLVERGTTTFRGRFTAAGARGTISSVARYTRRRTNQGVDRCSTGKVTWSARP